MKYQDVRDILEQHAKTMMLDPSLSLTGIGAAHPNGARIGTHDVWCVLAHVTDLAPSGCDTTQEYEQLLSEYIQDLTGNCDVVVHAELQSPHQLFDDKDLLPTLNTRRRFAALRTGISIINAECPSYDQDILSSGTLGLFGKKGSTRYLISNNHVLAGENAGKVGNAIVQPGTLDLSILEREAMPDLKTLKPRTQIAKLTSFVKVDLTTPDGQPENKVDLAWAELLPTPTSDDDLSLMAYGGRCIGVAPAYTEDANKKLQGDTQVYKVGRTTGYTEGQVRSIHYNVSLSYGGGTAFFKDQLLIEPTDVNHGAFGLPGDSGSAILDSHHRVVGLLFAGGDGKTVANPIAWVVDALQKEGISLVTSPVPSPAQEMEATLPQQATVALHTMDAKNFPKTARLVMYQSEDGAQAQVIQKLSVSTLSIPTTLSLSATTSDGASATCNDPKASLVYQATRDEESLSITKMADAQVQDELILVNRMTRGAMSVSLLRGDAIVATKTEISPFQMAVFSKTNKVALSVFHKEDTAGTLDLSKALSTPLLLEPKEGAVYHVSVVYAPSREERGEPCFLLNVTEPPASE